MAMSDRDRLAWTILGEAGRESRLGQEAVAHNILNRYYSGNYGNSISGVIMSPGQYSTWNDVTGYARGKGGISESLMANTSAARFASAQQIADDAMAGISRDPTGGSLNYYNPNTANPTWGLRSDSWTSTGSIGNHTFGASDGRALYDYSNPNDPRGSGKYTPEYQMFSPSGYRYADDQAPTNYKPDDFGPNAIGSGPPQSTGSLEADTAIATGDQPASGNDALTGDSVTAPKAGQQGKPVDVPTAIVTAADQEAKTAAASAKTTAEATLKATKDQTASDAKLQTEQQGFVANWAVRIFLFIVGAIFIAGGLFLFGGQKILSATAKVVP